MQYAINIWTNKSDQLAKDYMTETFKIFQQYTYLRNELRERDDQLKKAIKRTLDQESVIGELR